MQMMSELTAHCLRAASAAPVPAMVGLGLGLGVRFRLGSDE